MRTEEDRPLFRALTVALVALFALAAGGLAWDMRRGSRRRRREAVIADERRASDERADSGGAARKGRADAIGRLRYRRWPSIFLSYAREDRDRARQLVRVLEEEGFVVFWDRELLPGPSFRIVIAQELASAKCVITLWSTTSVVSDWVIDEAEQGRRRKILVSVRIDDVDPPLGLRQGQAAELSAWRGRRDDVEVDFLIRGVRKLAGPGQRAQPGRGDNLADALGGSLHDNTSEWRQHLARRPLVAPTLLLAVVFVVNLLETALDRVITPTNLGATAGYPAWRGILVVRALPEL